MHAPFSSASERRVAGIHIGCAGWNLPGAVRERFPQHGSHLQRYAAVFSAVEINTSFYRPHRPATYARWRESVPAAFRFSVKMPKAITHALRLQNVDEPLARFIGEAGNLEEKLGCLLVQLPPGLRYDAGTAERFFGTLRALTQTDVVCEPRHPTWFGAAAAQLLADMAVPYVAADPPATGRPVPPGSADTVYIRLHGSPVMYYSTYSGGFLDRLSADIADQAHAGKRVWCIFDNTASGASVPNALALMSRLRARLSVPASGTDGAAALSLLSATRR